MKNTKILLSLIVLGMFQGLGLQSGFGAEVKRSEVLEIYKKGASWYLKTQNPNGSWGEIPQAKEKGELGITALSVEALAKSPKELRASYKDSITKAVTWIISKQLKDGSITHDRSGLTVYRTALSIIALQAVDAKANKTVIDKAVKWLKEAQFEETDSVSKDDANYGGWGYDKSGSKPDADMSNTSMALQALIEAGVSKDDPAVKRALEFISRCQNNSETNKGVAKIKPKNDGGFFYDPGNSNNKSSSNKNADGTTSFESYAGMTYAGLMSLMYAKVGTEDPRVVAAVNWIKAHFNLDKNLGLGVRNPKPAADQQGLFYYYMVFSKALDLYGKREIETKDGKKDWVKELTTALAKRQKPSGFWINEASPRWWEGNPLVPTVFSLNALNRVLKQLPVK